MLRDLFNQNFNLDEAGKIFSQSLKDVLNATSVPEEDLNLNETLNTQLSREIFKRPSKYNEMDSETEEMWDEQGIPLGTELNIY